MRDFRFLVDRKTHERPIESKNSTPSDVARGRRKKRQTKTKAAKKTTQTKTRSEETQKVNPFN